MGEANQINQVIERLARVETKLDIMLDDRETAIEAQKTADKALQSAQSAHHRINRIDKVVFWAGTTVVGAVILGVITYFLKGGE